MRFYQQREAPQLAGREATIDFCQTINDMLDALNRKNPNEGVTPDGKDMEVCASICRPIVHQFDQGTLLKLNMISLQILKSSLSWLDD